MKKYDEKDYPHSELTYKIIGILYDVHNNLGSGYQEKYYCRAIAHALKQSNISYKEQVKYDIKYNGHNIGRYFADFLVDNRLILELKINPRIYPRDINQILGYLKESNLKVGIIASFNKQKVLIKRVINKISE